MTEPTLELRQLPPRHRQQPLLAQARATRGCAWLDELTTFLERPVPGEGYSLARGAAGRALALAALGRLEPAAGALELAALAVADEPSSPSLFAGFTGVAWAGLQLEARGLEAPLDSADVDAVLLQFVRSDSQAVPFDLIAGTSGLMLYACERPEADGPNLDLARAALRRLLQASEEVREGLRFRTPAHLLPHERRQSQPEGILDLGIAHGAPGCAAALASAVRAGLEEARTPLLRTCAWILSQELPSSSPGRFPAFARRETRDTLPPPSRLAWCYGDAGIAAVLANAALALDHAGLAAEAHRLALAAATRDPSSASVRDAGLCHGAAGLFHLFRRLHGAFGDEALQEAALRWLDLALSLHEPGAGSGGAFGVDELTGAKVARPGFLTGAAGIALALQAAWAGDSRFDLCLGLWPEREAT